MTVPHPSPQPFTVSSDDVPYDQVDALLRGALVAHAPVVVVDVKGPGAVTCIQGLLTNDLEAPGDNAFVYGAMLTSKGMIVCELWAGRTGAAVSLSVPTSGAASLREILDRSLPPRLARVSFRVAGEAQVLRLVGPATLDVALAAGLTIPSPGRVTPPLEGVAGLSVARTGGAPFELELVGPSDESANIARELESSGAVAAGPGSLELARILAGWPRLGAEIDEKTLPQEVRFDEINGVSYTKGCYTGQETVARVHFRGHPNRGLTGLTWRDTPDLEQSDVLQDGRHVGRVSSVAWLAPLERYVGLGVVRREVDRGEPVTAAGAPARLTELPFSLVG